MPEVSNDLLARRIEEYNIPAWPGMILFERVLIYKIPDEESASETAGDGVIIKPKTRIDTDSARCPRGIIVSAGLRALDVLHAYGMQLGELVWFAPHVPYRFQVGVRGGKDVEFSFMNVGDIVLSEDILDRLVPKTRDEAGNQLPEPIPAEMSLIVDQKMQRHFMYDNARQAPRRPMEPTHLVDEI